MNTMDSFRKRHPTKFHGTNIRRVYREFQIPNVIGDLRMKDIDEEIDRLENLKIQQEIQRHIEEHGIVVKYHCKKCGKKFKERLYPTQKIVYLKDKTAEDLHKEMEPKVQCPKCKSFDVERIDG